MRASLELQKALVAALTADAAMAARGIPVVDGPAADARPPFLAVGADLVAERGWKGGGGREHRFALTLWEASGGLAGAKAVLADVEAAVLAMPRAFAGVRLPSLRLTRATVRRTARGWVQGVLEFRALSVMEDG